MSAASPWQPFLQQSICYKDTQWIETCKWDKKPPPLHISHDLVEKKVIELIVAARTWAVVHTSHTRNVNALWIFPHGNFSSEGNWTSSKCRCNLKWVLLNQAFRSLILPGFKPFAFISQQLPKGAGILNPRSEFSIILLTTWYTELFICNQCKSAYLTQNAYLIIFANFCWGFKPCFNRGHINWRPSTEIKDKFLMGIFQIFLAGLDIIHPKVLLMQF